MLLADTHFGHRASAGIVVDLFWSHGDRGDRFRVEVQDTCARDRFVLYPATGPEAIHAFHHPFASARSRNRQQKPAPDDAPRPDHRHQRTPTRYPPGDTT